MSFPRRAFLVAAGTGAAVATLTNGGVPGRALAGGREPGFGPLIDDPERLLDLAEGFTYRVLERWGDDMDDGYIVPAAPDGMACFEGRNGSWVLMRNHELADTGGPLRMGDDIPAEAFDAGRCGGVTRLVVDPESGDRLSSNLVLLGTTNNCAGGPSPWGWLSCEEDVEEGHGYVFLCDPEASRVAPARPIPAYGRCRHEAAAVDPETHVAYLTEDRGDSCLYRFVPDDPEEPFVGRLQAMVLPDAPGLDTAEGLQRGDTFDVSWVDLEDPDPVDDTLRYEAQGKGAATIRRGEGIAFHEGSIWICSTNGGPAGSGQIFRLDIAAQRLELVVQSEDELVLEMPDNITVSPGGQLFMVEDGDGQNYIRALGDDGDIVDFGRTTLGFSELAGVCFSPDGSTMFVNVQWQGITLAITGPFRQPAPPEGPPSDGPPLSPPDEGASLDCSGCATSDRLPVSVAAAFAALGMLFRRRAAASVSEERR